MMGKYEKELASIGLHGTGNIGGLGVIGKHIDAEIEEKDREIDRQKLIRNTIVGELNAVDRQLSDLRAKALKLADAVEEFFSMKKSLVFQIFNEADDMEQLAFLEQATAEIFEKMETIARELKEEA